MFHQLFRLRSFSKQIVCLVNGFFFINFNAYKFQSNSGGAEEFGKSVKMFSALRRSPETSDEYS